MSEHTPMPWQCHGSHIYGPNPDRQLVCNVKDHGRNEKENPMMANINLILRAVNNHDDLVEALEAIAAPEGAWNNDREIYYKNIIDNCIKIAERALKAVKGE